MADPMNPIDREMLIAATLSGALCDVDTEPKQAVANLQEILFQIALRGGVSKMRKDAREMVASKAKHQETARNAR